MSYFQLAFFLSFIFMVKGTSYGLTFLPPFEIQGRAKQPLTFTPNYTGNTGAEVFSTTGLPTGLSINSSNGQITGIPTNKLTNVTITIFAVLPNLTNSQSYTLNVRRKFRSPQITSRLFKSIEVKWDPYRSQHEIDGKYRITGRGPITNFGAIFPVGQTGQDDEPIPWPTNWPDFKARRGEIDFHYREGKRRIPTGKFKIQIFAFGRGGSFSNTLELEITKKDE